MPRNFYKRLQWDITPYEKSKTQSPASELRNQRFRETSKKRESEMVLIDTKVVGFTY